MEIESKEQPASAYFETVKELFYSKTFKKDKEEPDFKRKSIEGGKTTLSIAEKHIGGKAGFFVNLNNFSYYITADGVEYYEMPAIKNAYGIEIPKSATKVYADTPNTRRIAAKDLVSWTERTATANTILPFPYQPKGYSQR